MYCTIIMSFLDGGRCLRYLLLCLLLSSLHLVILGIFLKSWFLRCFCAYKDILSAWAFSLGNGYVLQCNRMTLFVCERYEKILLLPAFHSSLQFYCWLLPKSPKEDLLPDIDFISYLFQMFAIIFSALSYSWNCLEIMISEMF